MTAIDEAITDLIRATGSHVVGASSSNDVMRSASELISLITQAIAEARADGRGRCGNLRRKSRGGVVTAAAMLTP